MAENFQSCDHEDEDYIDMEVSSHSQFINHPITSSPPHPREFEFQMFSNFLERETTSPADELFYKGKLLPLHLPPRLQMVQKLLQNSNSYDHKKDNFEEFFSTPLTTNPNNTPKSNTPFQSCNNSPSQSFQISRELNPDEYFCDFSSETSDFISANPNKSWTRKLKLIKQSSSIGSKLKASRAYLKALFGKSGCSDESCKVAARNVDERSISKTNKDCLNKYIKVAKKAPFGQISTTNREKVGEDHGGRRHRRSFSGAITQLSTTKISSSSSSSSSDSSWSNPNWFLKRSSSVNSDIQSSIQGAIAYCKKSQYFQSGKTASEVGFCSLSASRKVSQDQESPGLCRG